jgi:hypothetical protein
MFKLDQIARAGLSRIDTIRVVRTAVNPLLWQAGLTTPLFLLAAILIDDRLVRLILVALATLFVFPAIIAYFILMFRDPDRLQSEEYRSRLQELRCATGRAGSPLLSTRPMR